MTSCSSAGHSSSPCLLLPWALCNYSCVFKSLYTFHMQGLRANYVASYIKRLILIASKDCDFGSGGKKKATPQSQVCFFLVCLSAPTDSPLAVWEDATAVGNGGSLFSLASLAPSQPHRSALTRWVTISVLQLCPKPCTEAWEIMCAVGLLHPSSRDGW